ncbi:helix-turn-helix domain-containing protein [Nocardia sp. NPDC058499]|uniref:helix-turn-helix domain-containing protein n=1 Tax=Nocardia sp. NPDC058499 TaxID=3346530 RepID=UPI00365A576D
MGFPAVSYLPAELPACLRRFVASVVAYDVRIGESGSYVGLPSTTLTLQLASGAPLRVGWVSQPEESRALWGILAGLHTRPARVVHDGRMAGVEIALTIDGARTLFGVRASELADSIVDPGEVSPAFELLVERVALAATPRQRLDLAVRGLLAALEPEAASPGRPEVGYALARLTRGARVDEIATETGLSRRHLAGLVKAECGLTPKRYRGVARFERAYRTMLERAAHGGRPALAAIAAQAGYADQAHMTNEWRQMAGTTPSAWLRTEFPLIQDTQGA